MSLTEQICTNNTLGCVGHKDGKCHSIENCKYKVEQPVITIGDISEQKEPCKGCKHYGNYENEVEYGYPSPCTKCKRRCVDNYQPDATDINVTTKTIGDKIRESNESLAEFIYKIQMIPQQPVGDGLKYILEYLNQPYTES